MGSRCHRLPPVVGIVVVMVVVAVGCVVRPAVTHHRDHRHDRRAGVDRRGGTVCPADGKPAAGDRAADRNPRRIRRRDDHGRGADDHRLGGRGSGPENQSGNTGRGEQAEFHDWAHFQGDWSPGDRRANPCRSHACGTPPDRVLAPPRCSGPIAVHPQLEKPSQGIGTPPAYLPHGGMTVVDRMGDGLRWASRLFLFLAAISRFPTHFCPSRPVRIPRWCVFLRNEVPTGCEGIFPRQSRRAFSITSRRPFLTARLVFSSPCRTPIPDTESFR